MKGKLFYIFLVGLILSAFMQSECLSSNATFGESIRNDGSTKHLSSRTYNLAAVISDLTVTVKNVNATLKTAAQVKLYNADNTSLISTLFTNSSGQVIFSDLSDGTYKYDVYYTSVNTTPLANNTEFWGSGQVTINGSSQSVIFTRNQPYISVGATFSPAILKTSQSTSGSFTVKNILTTSIESYVSVWVDRDKSGLWDYTENIPAKTIVSGSTSTYPVSVTPTISGTYYYYAFVYSKVNGTYVITDQYSWTQAFVAENQEPTIESIVINGTVFGPESTVHVDVTVFNPGIVAKTCKSFINIDMDKLPAYDFESGLQGPVTIQPGQRSVFGFDWTIPPNTLPGTFYISSGVQTLYDTGYIISDSTNWDSSIKNENSTISQIVWSGLTWNIKSGTGLGPGNNNWLANSSSVWVDGEGNLHLKIRKIGTKWYCAEINAKPLLGYGDYTFQISSNVENLDKNIVLGLFTYETDTREIDIEFSRWSDPLNQAGWYNVQPSSSTNHHGFSLNLTNELSTHKFIWNPSEVFFQSYFGHYQYLPEKEKLISEWTYTGTQIPPAGNERVILNLWLYKGVPPSDLKEAEVVIKSFTFKKVGDLVVQVQNVDNTSLPIPGLNGIVKLYNDKKELISTQTTNQNGAVTFPGIPVGSGYYYQVFHLTANPAAIYGQEYWGTMTDIKITDDQTTTSSFKRNQPYIGIVKVYNGTTNVTGQLIEPGTPLRIEQQIINPSSQTQNARGRVILDIDKNELFDYYLAGNSLTSIPANSFVTQSWSVTPTINGQYYSAGGVQTLFNNDTIISAGDAWSVLPVFTVSPSFNLNLISDAEQKVTQNSTANWFFSIKNTGSVNNDFSLITEKGTFFYQGKQIVKTPVMMPNEELNFELRFNSEWTEPGTNGKIKVSIRSNNDPNREKSIEVTYTIIQSALVLKTNNVTSITLTTAISGGTIVSTGGTIISTKGICWGTAAFPTTFLDTKTTEGSENASFSGNITGLRPGTTYHVRAYAINAVSVAYGNDVEFTTEAFNPPVANFSAAVTNGCNPLTVNFSDQSTASPTSWAWDVDNNGTVDYTIKNPEHTYNSAGTYSVKLTVTNISGSDSTIFAGYITINPIVLPDIRISAIPSQKVDAGQLVTFTATSTNGGTNPKYEWKVDGAITGTNSSTYASTGLINGQVVSCKMTSNDPCTNPKMATSNAVTMEVKPLNKLPLANAGADQSVNEGTLVTLNGLASSDPDNNPLTYLWIAPAGIALSSATASKPTFTAPEVKKDTLLNFSLIVNDGSINSLPSSVKISVKNVIKTSGEELVKGEFKIYPNPTSGIFKIEGMQSGGKTKIEIYSIEGKLITKTISDSTTYEIDISCQISGTYLLVINNQTIRIVKE